MYRSPVFLKNSYRTDLFFYTVKNINLQAKNTCLCTTAKLKLLNKFAVHYKTKRQCLLLLYCRVALVF